MTSDTRSTSIALRRWLLIAVGAAAAIVFVALAAREVAWSGLRDAMSSARLFPWIPLGALAYVAGVFLRGWRLRLLISHESRISVLTASNVVAIGYAINNVLPGRLGELGRAHALTRQTSMSFTQAFTVTVLERVLDGLVMLFLFAVAASVGSRGFFESELASAMVNGLAFALFAGFAFSVAFATLSPHGFTRVVAGAAGRLRASWHDPVYALCLHITSGVAYLRRPAGAISVVLLSVATWLVEGLMFLAALAAFALPANFGVALLTMTVTNLGIAIPSTPGYIGPWHFFCGETLRLSGVDASIALSFAIVTHLSFFVPITIWGGAVLLAYGMDWGTAARLRTPRDRRSAVDRFAHLAALPARDEHKDVSRAARFYDALVEALMPVDDLPLDEADRQRTKEYVLQFVFGQLRCLPNRIFVLYAIGVLGFRALTVVRYARPFESLPLEKRVRWVALWADGPIGLTRKLFRPLRSFVFLSFYEYPPVHAALDAVAGDAAAGAAS